MLYVPIFIFLLNGSFTHVGAYDKVYMDYQLCLHDVAEAVTGALKDAPEGRSVKGGCLPLGDGVKPPTEPVMKPCDTCKEL